MSVGDITHASIMLGHDCAGGGSGFYFITIAVTILSFFQFLSFLAFAGVYINIYMPSPRGIYNVCNCMA